MSEKTKPETIMEENNIDNNTPQTTQKDKKPNLLFKILTFIPNLIANAIGAVVGFFAGIKMGVKEINKENRAAKTFQTNKTDKELFNTIENAQEQNTKDEITEIGKKLHELAPDVILTRGNVSEIIQEVKETGKPYNLGEEFGIPALIYLEDGVVNVESFKNLNQIDNFEKQIEDVYKAWGEELSQETRLNLRKSMLKLMNNKETAEHVFNDTVMIFDGKFKQLIIEGTLPPEWNENPPEWLNATPESEHPESECPKPIPENAEQVNEVETLHPRYFDEAIKIAVDKEVISTGQLQRIFKIGYNEATKLMEALENEKIVVASEDGKTYKSQITKEEFEKKHHKSKEQEQEKENKHTPVNEEKPKIRDDEDAR